MAFVKGQVANPRGRPKGSKNKVALGDLEEAMKKAAKKHDKVTILEHFINRAYVNDNVLIALMKKTHPDKKSIDAFVGVMEGRMSPEDAEAIREKLKERFNPTKGD